ncbi:MAG: methionyl-tRNA formyltransferase [Acidiferrobacteraceae bacterium]
MNVVFAGTPPFAVPALEAIAAHHQVVRVLTRPDQPAGRGRSLKPSAVKERATAMGLRVSTPADATDAEAAAAEAPADVLVVVAYGMLLKTSMFARTRLGALNIHASLLPRWRGAAPIARAIEAGDAKTGISIMCMEAGLDTGPVLYRAAEPILPSDTARTLHDRLSLLGGRAILAGLVALEAGVAPEPQDPARATYARKLSKDEGRVDWTAEAALVARRIRAFDPYPVASTLFRGVRVRLFDALPAESSHPGARPGEILGLHPSGGGLGIAAGGGAVTVRRLQMEGGRVLEAAAFVNGYRIAPGEHLG